ncbi:hypothetical protein H6P81_006059 [Aristolochia fimbriata]|uniref:Aminotransferase-like plant mobile domain-containing protein n=1 Tax=Aristolochia fimbriata TaxID=158543 RepID=A0AAV7EWA0_ARIFI|nr:hypothetical protein H6P81_006059 [Aristolochia fimbriata]
MSRNQWALAYDGNMSFGKLTKNFSESVNSLLKRAWSLPVQALTSAIFYRMNAWPVSTRLTIGRLASALGHQVVMADTPLLYDQDSNRSEAIWRGEDPRCLESTEHFQTLRHWPVDERMLPYIKAAGFSVLYRVQCLRLDKLLITALLWEWECLHTGRPTLLEEPALQGGPLGSRWNVRWTNATNPSGNLVLYKTELDHQRSYQVKWQSYLDFMQHLPAICVEGRRIWLSRTPLICFEIVELHVPDRVMLQFGLGQLGCVWNVVERVNHSEALYPSSADPYLMDIGHYCQSVLHCLPLLEGAIVGGDVSHVGEPSHVVEPARDRAPRGRRARRRPTAETKTRVEDFDEVPAVLEPTVPDLPPEQTPDPEPDQPLERPPEPEPSRHPPIRRIYTRRQKKAIGAPEPSSSL